MSTKPLEVAPYIDKLVTAVLMGATYELAALYAGISPRTFIRWRQRAVTARPGTPLAELRDRLAEAEGRAAVGWLAKIEAAASDGNWQAAAWKLERRYPETYGRSMQKVALTTPDGEESWKPAAQIPETFFTDLAAIFQQLGPLHQPPLLSEPPAATNGHASPTSD